MDGAFGPREAHGVGEEIVEDLAHALLVGDEALGVVGDGDVEREAGPPGRLADAGDRRVDDVMDVDVRELELEAAGVDRRQVEDVVDDGEKRFRGGADVVQVFALLGRQAGQYAGCRAAR